MRFSLHKSSLPVRHSNTASGYDSDGNRIRPESYDAVTEHFIWTPFSVKLIKLIYPIYSLVGGIIVFSIIATARIPGGWGGRPPRSFKFARLDSNNVPFYTMPGRMTEMAGSIRMMTEAI